VHILDIMPIDGSEPAKNYKAIRNELKLYSKALAKKPEVIVANKIDLDPDGKIVKELKKKLRKKMYPVSAATGAGVKELKEILWQKVKETKAADEQ
jgi:GTP-binding protein